MNKRTIEIWADGGARGNPGPAAIGVCVKVGAKMRYEWSKYIGSTTNNQAEYRALIEALKWVQSKGITSQQYKISIYLDSELVVRQLHGVYRVKQPGLKDLYRVVQEYLLALGEIKFFAVPRSLNKRADLLVNMALDRQGVSSL